jgi:hypothetical protein
MQTENATTSKTSSASLAVLESMRLLDLPRSRIISRASRLAPTSVFAASAFAQVPNSRQDAQTSRQGWSSRVLPSNRSAASRRPHRLGRRHSASAATGSWWVHGPKRSLACRPRPRGR